MFSKNKNKESTLTTSYMMEHFPGIHYMVVCRAVGDNCILEAELQRTPSLMQEEVRLEALNNNSNAGNRPDIVILPESTPPTILYRVFLDPIAKILEKKIPMLEKEKAIVSMLVQHSKRLKEFSKLEIAHILRFIEKYTKHLTPKYSVKNNMGKKSFDFINKMRQVYWKLIIERENIIRKIEETLPKQVNAEYILPLLENGTTTEGGKRKTRRTKRRYQKKTRKH